MHSGKENKFILSFTGKIRYDTIGTLINELKGKVISEGIQTALYKKILLVMIESLENIMKYTAELSDIELVENTFPPRFYIQRKDHKYIVGSSNLVEKMNVSHLEQKLKQLNNLDKHGLKELYKTTITNGQFSPKGGAGLGLIEIAKISSTRIKYSFKPVNDLLAYYQFSITIDC